MEDGIVFHGLMSRNKAKKENHQFLTLVELTDDILDCYPHQLSGGQLQRVAITRAVSIYPDISILDEAASFLEALVQEQILNLLVKLQNELKISCLFISHDLAVIKAVIHRIYVLHQGRVVEEIISQKIHDAKDPYTQKLLSSVYDFY